MHYCLQDLIVIVFTKHQCLVVRATRWRSGYSVRFLVGRPGVHSHCRVISKDFKKSYPQLLFLALGSYGRLWRTSRKVRLLWPWAMHLTGRLRLYEEDRWPGLERDGLRHASQPKISCMINTTKTNWSSAAPQRQSPWDKCKKTSVLHSQHRVGNGPNCKARTRPESGSNPTFILWPDLGPKFKFPERLEDA